MTRRIVFVALYGVCTGVVVSAFAPAFSAEGLAALVAMNLMPYFSRRME